MKLQHFRFFPLKRSKPLFSGSLRSGSNDLGRTWSSTRTEMDDPARSRSDSEGSVATFLILRKNSCLSPPCRKLGLDLEALRHDRSLLGQNFYARSKIFATLPLMSIAFRLDLGFYYLVIVSQPLKSSIAIPFLSI